MSDGSAAGPAALDLGRLDRRRLPAHVGIIMDGNGRWAASRNLPRTTGHAAGETVLFECVEGALEIGLRWLSAYTFSTENWTRHPEEVSFLMWFNEDILLRRLGALADMGVRICFAGDLADRRIPDRNRALMRDAEQRTATNRRLSLVLAFNYGGRAEIARAVRALAIEVAEGGREPGEITEDDIARRLYVPGMPDPDLIVRTSGEMRLSNFLLWGSAYSELVFTETLWPEFGAQHLVDAVVEYQRRRRRFGGAVPNRGSCLGP